MDTTVQFPVVSGTSLGGAPIHLPQGFESETTLALLAFWDWQQPMVETWVERAARLESSSADFSYLEFPVIQATNDEVHEFIDAGMRAGIPDLGARSRTVTLYVDKRDFLRSLGLPTDDEVYAVLVRSGGRVLQLWEGSMTPQAGAELEKLVTKGVSEAPS